MIQEELKNLIVYTGVFYQDNETYRTRSQIWFKTFDNAKKLGIKVVVRNDGGLPLEMLERIKAYDNITIVEKDPLKKNTLGGGRREALQKAIDIAKEDGISNPVFLWTEPEKDDLITEKNLIPLVAEINAGANMVIPERGENAWNELSKQQRWLEQRAEKRVQEKIMKSSERLDLWFGPKVLDLVGADYFLQYNSNNDRIDLWDSLMVPVLEAKKDGLKVTSVPLDFSYDESQTAKGAEAKQEGIPTKRIEQYAQILKELGDLKWVDFFEDSKRELDKIKEIHREKPENKEQLLREKKKSLIKNFFRMK
ncbi:hypothetical protein A2917_03605 [Candidatus Nomurabacteria bacterium RIFCSPLOWO2_01_FULL_42_17]|uniref:Uncharacterized protein n=1 Tax=Candidatus Nomurabacteria bacterium RIFCSPLOWO2_01_FULL_42_17 TaxID=1801780 RepID=A0A1F6XNN8_9BACT|nr:MAG: hypothetical protein A2917_03605 [Candidatus Nomurabacteria bacterium RIFCSPLOWO2_01_FULL_42_17]